MSDTRTLVVSTADVVKALASAAHNTTELDDGSTLFVHTTSYGHTTDEQPVVYVEADIETPGGRAFEVSFGLTIVNFDVCEDGMPVQPMQRREAPDGR